MRYVLPFILSACAVAEGAAPRPVGMTWSAVSVDCIDGYGRTPSVPGAFVQAAACADGVCWSVGWTEDAEGWQARCNLGATVVEWTWIVPTR